jgi:nitrogen fixation protein FixH
MRLSLYNRKTRTRMEREARKATRTKLVVNSDTMMRKTCIVTDMNGREIARNVVTASFDRLAAEYEVVASRMRRAYPRSYIFCDRSEGTIVQ